LFAHDDLPGNILGLGDEGLFKTPTLRNATKNERGITKAFMHNGYFKTIEDVVHFYNTRFVKIACEIAASSRRPPRKRSPMIAGPRRSSPAQSRSCQIFSGSWV
jgi:hypothetical protein